MAVATSTAQLLQELRALADGAGAMPPAAIADALQRLASCFRDAASEAGASSAPSIAAEEAAAPACVTTAGHAAEREASAGPEAGPAAGEQAEEEEEGEGGEEPRSEPGSAPRPAKKKRRKEKEHQTRTLDFSRYRERYVALEVMYIGGQYAGFARQDTSDNTIEAHLFNAMRKTTLIRPDVDVNNLRYSRCGRTDKGVSALGQVVALNLRSAGRVDQEAIAEDKEMDYPRILNRALPPEIRVLGWAAAPPEFNARFCAQYRQYKYFIVQDKGAAGGAASGSGLDIDRMREAAQHFRGQHDFRNFCKPDIASVRSFVRKIHTFDIEPVHLGDERTGAQVYALNIRGTAFLWHQVRYMASVLLMVGRGLEEPDIVRQLLNLEEVPRKPQYCMAPEEPLLLYACGFEALRFRRTERAIENTVAVLATEQHRHLIAAALTSSILARLASDEKVVVPGERCGHMPTHQALLKRQKEPSMEERAKKLGIVWPPVQAAEADEAMEDG